MHLIIAQSALFGKVNRPNWQVKRKKMSAILIPHSLCRSSFLLSLTKSKKEVAKAYCSATSLWGYMLVTA